MAYNLHLYVLYTVCVCVGVMCHVSCKVLKFDRCRRGVCVNVRSSVFSVLHRKC